MRAPESPFERYMSKRILFFAYLICSSVSGAKALKKCLRFAIFNFSEKLQNIFEKGLKNMEKIRRNQLLKGNLEIRYLFDERGIFTLFGNFIKS